MATILITYDLNRPGQNYDKLYEAIKGLGSTWAHPVDSTWLVRTDLGVVAIRDRLTAYLDNNDALIVLATVRQAAWRGLSDALDDWLEKNL